jgi:hypothetical protein
MRMEVFPAPCFDCGSDGLRCASDAEYCERAASDVGGIPDAYACEPTPAECRAEGAIPDCDCLAERIAFDDCIETGPGELTVVHFGG